MSKDPATKAEQKLVHHQAFYREQRKTKESRYRNFKDRPMRDEPFRLHTSESAESR
jgi:hypothetical protein